jgi:hypothetical protein
VISRNTISILDLKPVTRDRCYDFYMKLSSEFSSMGAIKESVSWWQDNKDKLNHLWWVLNYYSESLDPERALRAHVESHLDALALEKSAILEALPEPDGSQTLEQA